jgi:hypothetical protein
MPKKSAVTELPGVPQKVDVKPRSPDEWMKLLADVSQDHWRRFHVTIQIRDKLLAGKPARLDAAKAMLKARGLESAIEAVNIADPNALAQAAGEAVDEGLCEFHRREGQPGIWFPTNNIKAGIKENWSVLGLRVEHRGSRGALAEGVFVYSTHTELTTERNWILLGDKPDGIVTSVTHTTGPSGPIAAIKRNEFVTRPRFTFEIAIAKAVSEKLPDESFVRMLYHFGEHGMGACRSQGFGMFDIIGLQEV